LQNDHPVENREPDIEAYNLVLEGNYFKARNTLSDVEQATQLYRRAVEINPDYALAWARLADAYLAEEGMGRVPSEEQDRRVLDSLARAIRIDPNLAWAYYVRAGFELDFRWNWLAAQMDDERVRELDPRFDLLPRAFGDLALTFGEVDKAVALYQTDFARNPLDSTAIDSLGNALCYANRLQPCLQTYIRLLQLHPDYGSVNSSIGIAYLYLGQFAAALKAMQKEPEEHYRLTGLAMIYSALGRRTESDAALNSLTEKFASSDPYGIAAVYAYRGEIDAAFQWLDRGYQQHNYRMSDVKADPLLRNLRGDPRFEALLSRMGLDNPRQSETPRVRARELKTASLSF
jgi:tetratricopeptide (TPR) repeat protein